MYTFQLSWVIWECLEQMTARVYLYTTLEKVRESHQSNIFSWQWKIKANYSEIIKNMKFVCSRFNITLPMIHSISCNFYFLITKTARPTIKLIVNKLEQGHKLKVKASFENCRLLASSMADVSTTKLQLFLLMYQPWEVKENHRSNNVRSNYW